MVLRLEDIKNQPNVIRTSDPDYIKKYMGRRIPEEYSAIFRYYSWNNKNYDYATFHTVFGAYMNFVRFYFGANFEDIRFHTHIFAPTSTGKSRAFAGAFDFAKALGLKTYSVNKLTTASLVGTIDEHGEKIYGAVLEQSGNDLIGIEEASILYNKKKPEYAEDVLKILQSAMNPYRSTHNYIRTRLARGEVGGYSYSSYLLATYPPATISEIITETGFLQRLFIIYRSYNDAIRRKNEDKLIESLGNQYAVHNPDVYFKYIVRKLKHIKKFYLYSSLTKTDPSGFRYFPMDFSHEAKQTLKLASLQLENKYSYSYGTIREQLANFRTRFMINLIKIAVHHALLRLSLKVEPQDVAYAQNIVLPEFESLMFFIERSMERNERDMKDRKIYNEIFKIYKNIVIEKYKEIVNKINNIIKEHNITSSKQLKKSLTSTEILALDYWIPKYELIERVAIALSFSKPTVEQYILQFSLDLNDKTNRREIQNIIKKNPHVKFILSNRGGGIQYIRAVYNVTGLPHLSITTTGASIDTKSQENVSIPRKLPSEYKIEIYMPEDNTLFEDDEINRTIPDEEDNIPVPDDEEEYEEEYELSIINEVLNIYEEE